MLGEIDAIITIPCFCLSSAVLWRSHIVLCVFGEIDATNTKRFLSLNSAVTRGAFTQHSTYLFKSMRSIHFRFGISYLVVHSAVHRFSRTQF